MTKKSAFSVQDFTEFKTRIAEMMPGEPELIMAVLELIDRYGVKHLIVNGGTGVHRNPYRMLRFLVFMAKEQPYCSPGIITKFAFGGQEYDKTQEEYRFYIQAVGDAARFNAMSEGNEEEVNCKFSYAPFAFENAPSYANSDGRKIIRMCRESQENAIQRNPNGVILSSCYNWDPDGERTGAPGKYVCVDISKVPEPIKFYFIENNQIVDVWSLSDLLTRVSKKEDVQIGKLLMS